MTLAVAIIGGGIIGSAAAYFLARGGLARQVSVIEPDPTYRYATTPQAAGGVRRQFSRPENIELSQFSLAFYKDFAGHMADIPDVPEIGFREQGYLLVTGAGGAGALTRNHELQTGLGVPAELMDGAEVRRRFPAIGRRDIALGCYTPEDAWIDPAGALMGFRKAAQHLGVTYIPDRVTGIEAPANRSVRLQLAGGDRVVADTVINAAGPWVGDIAAMTGDKLPVEPMCRVQHFWRCREASSDLPLVKDEDGLFFRPEGEGFVGGLPSFDIAPGFVDEVDRGFFADYFEDSVWPRLAKLVPAFETLKCERTWGGHYAQNLFDGNMIIGPYAPGRGRLLTACGFSGHGIMHAPAVGRALSELVQFREYRTIDLERLGFDRVSNDKPYPEIGIK